MPKQKIRIKLKGYDHKILDQSAEQIVAAVERTGAVVSGPVPLPTRIKKFSVIRSRLKSITRSIRFAPPPRWRTVILP